MKNTFSIFGAGAAGLYTAWRLLNGKHKGNKKVAGKLSKGDTIELYDWGEYNFSAKDSGTREACGRVCTYHFDNAPENSFVELGGMRYSYWDGKNNAEAAGHRLVTQTIADLGLDEDSVPFDESDNPLYYLRTRNQYLNDISSSDPAPYNVDHYGNAVGPQEGFSIVEDLAVTHSKTREQWCKFYQEGRINVDLPESSVFNKGDLLKDIGYWNLMFDQLGSEGYQYTAAGNGYSSNVINWNSAEAFQANNEFTPGTEYKTLEHGYSTLFSSLFQSISKLAKKKGVHFEYYPNQRLHSILEKDGVIHYTIATRQNPDKKAASKTTNFAWLAMPRAAIDLVAQATRYQDTQALDVLNHTQVQLYLESAIIQPSYKIGMFFHEEWWKQGSQADPKYPALLTSYDLTLKVLAELKKEGFPKRIILKLIKNGDDLIDTPIASAEEFMAQVEAAVGSRLSYAEEQRLLTAAERDTIGPSVTDTPIRQVVYFGNNAPDKKERDSDEPVYGILASYDDEMFTSFWQELELGPDATRKVPLSENYQPLEGPRHMPDVMIKMLRKQLAHVHFGPQANYNEVPPPLESVYMDWSLPPFKAGYHAYAAHYDICDVQQKIRKPSQLIEGQDANIFIVGEAYSNDQAWVEGAFGTAESVLNDFFGIEPIIDNTHYPFICGPCGRKDGNCDDDSES